MDSTGAPVAVPSGRPAGASWYHRPVAARVLVIDNYDSFVYNLVQELGELGADPVVFRNDAIDNGASMHEVREFAGHSDIRTTELYFVRKEEDAEVAARRIQIRLMGRKGE